MEIELESLVGRHILDAVDFDVIQKARPYDEDARTMTFRLDGITYTATEDPSDGYRSAMEHLEAEPVEMKNVFAPCNVLCAMRADDTYRKNDVLDMIDEITGKVVLSVGTENTDDYYPNYVDDFMPENMAANAGREPGQ